MDKIVLSSCGPARILNQVTWDPKKKLWGILQKIQASGRLDFMKSKPPGKWASWNPSLRQLRFHEVWTSGDMDFMKSKPQEVSISWNPDLRRARFHEIQLPGKLDFMKSISTEVWVSWNPSFRKHGKMDIRNNWKTNSQYLGSRRTSSGTGAMGSHTLGVPLVT